jgi:hypothetical protein
MNRPHKTVEYDLDTVLSKENESSPTIVYNLRKPINDDGKKGEDQP